MPRKLTLRRGVLLVAALALLGSIALVLVAAVPDPPDVLWFPSPNIADGESDLVLANSPDADAGSAWEVVDHMIDPEDRFWSAITVVPRRSLAARWLERISTAIRRGPDAAPEARGWFYSRCAAFPVRGPAAYAFTGLRGGEAAEVWGREEFPDVRFRNLARERLGAARFGELAGR
jgi:hypothetical protein